MTNHSASLGAARNQISRAVPTTRAAYQALFETTAVGVAHTGLEGEWLSANHVVCELLGYSEEALLDKTVQQHTHPDDLPAEQRLMRQMRDGERDEYQLEKRFIRKDGKAVWVSVHACAVRDAEGQPSYFSNVFVNLTQRRHLEARLASNSDLLEQGNRLFASFTHAVSHDLRAPLRAVLGFAEILVEDHAQQLDDEAREVVEVVRRNAERLSRMIQAIVDYSRLSRRPLHPETVPMRELAREAFDSAIAAAPACEVDLHIGSLPAVSGDPEMLSLVWKHLASNAVRYRRENAVRVDVEARAGETGEWCFEVRDNGTGFAQDYEGDLFRMFGVLHHSERAGLGVGLAFAQSVIRRHGGRIWAQGQPGVGATLHFTLPDSAQQGDPYQ